MATRFRKSAGYMLLAAVISAGLVLGNALWGNDGDRPECQRGDDGCLDDAAAYETMIETDERRE